jgi:polar amino acid transport system ATP-binding protein
MSDAVIEIRGVTKSFDELEVLKGIDLTVHEHEAVALIGASGSGKSTLLRCIDLLEEIDDGDIFLDGEVITDPSVEPVEVRRRLGFVFQAYNLFPHLRVLDNVTLGITRAHGVGGPVAETQAREILARFGLEGREDEKPSHLSGGQQQRVAIARAFATRPRAMLLDEVTSALDPGNGARIEQLVAGLTSEGIAAVWVTHDLDQLERLARHVVVIIGGSLAQAGLASEVLDRPTADVAAFLSGGAP